jgi:hypothetical protein
VLGSNLRQDRVYVENSVTVNNLYIQSSCIFLYNILQTRYFTLGPVIAHSIGLQRLSYGMDFKRAKHENIRKTYPYNSQWGPIRLGGVEVSQIVYTIGLQMAARLSALRTDSPLPPGRFLVLISVRD